MISVLDYSARKNDRDRLLVLINRRKQLINVKLIKVYFYRGTNILRSTVWEFLSSLHVGGARRSSREGEGLSRQRASSFKDSTAVRRTFPAAGSRAGGSDASASRIANSGVHHTPWTRGLYTTARPPFRFYLSFFRDILSRCTRCRILGISTTLRVERSNISRHTLKSSTR